MEQEPQSFTNRELWMLIDKNNQTNLLQHQSLMDGQREFHKTTKETLDLILSQTSKTNGRVNKLELWQSYISGQVWIIPTIVGAVVSGIIAFIINHFKA